MNKLEKMIRKTILPFESGKEYKVSLNDIIIQDTFREHPPRKKKMKRKWRFFWNSSVPESRIILNKNFVLTDGYTSYLIWDSVLSKELKSCDIVPVYFDMDAEVVE